MNDLELRLLEEFNKLQSFVVKNPVDKRAFWGEWQSLFTKVKLRQIAIKAVLMEVSDKELIKYLHNRYRILKEIEGYLKELKDVALQVKGYSIFATEESGEDDEDSDDLLF